MRRVNQAVLALLPAEAVPVGPIAGLVEGAEGGVVFVSGMATFAFAAGDEVGRRLAAVGLVTTDIASAVAVADAFDVSAVTLWRWRRSFETHGVSGLMAAKTGPKGPHKLTEQIITRVRELDEQGLSLAAVGTAVGVSTSTVRVALGRVTTAPGQPGTQTPTDEDPDPDPADEHDRDLEDRDGEAASGASNADGGDQPGQTLAVVPMRGTESFGPGSGGSMRLRRSRPC